MTPLLAMAAASIMALAAKDYALVESPQALPARAVTGEVAAELAKHAGDASVVLARDEGGDPIVLLIDRGKGVDHLFADPGPASPYTDFGVCAQGTERIWLRIAGKGFVNSGEKCDPKFRPRPVSPDDQGFNDNGPYVPTTEFQLTGAVSRELAQQYGVRGDSLLTFDQEGGPVYLLLQTTQAFIWRAQCSAVTGAFCWLNAERKKLCQNGKVFYKSCQTNPSNPWRRTDSPCSCSASLLDEEGNEVQVAKGCSAVDKKQVCRGMEEAGSGLAAHRL
jgi:hypothetical protein